MIHIVHHIRYRLLGQIGDGMYGSHLHLLVDGSGVYVKGTTEDIGETDHVVNLVGVVGTTRSHKRVRTSLHGILVRDLRNGISQREDHRILGHGLHHLLGKHVTF